MPGGSGASRSASQRWPRRSNWCGERGGALNLEIKGESVEESVGTAEAVEPVLRALEEPLRSRLLVSSFEHPAVALLKERLPWLRVATLYSGREWQKADMLAPALAMGAEAIHPGVGLTTADLVTRAHAGDCASTSGRPTAPPPSAS